MPVKLAPITNDTQTGAAGSTLTFQIPNDYPIAAYILRVNGTLVVATAAAQALQNFGAVNAIKNVRISAKGEQRLDISGKIHYLDSYLMNQGAMPLVDPVLTIGTNPYNFTLQRFFQMQRMIYPVNDRGIFPNHIIRDCEILVTLGNAGDMAVAGVGGTVSLGNVTVEITYLQVVDTSPALTDPNFYVNEQLATLGANAGIMASLASPSSDILLNVGGKYRYIGLIVEAPSGAGGAVVGRDDLLGFVRLKANRTELVRQTFGSLQVDNQASFLLEDGTFPTPSNNALGMPSGVAVIDYTRHGAPIELYDSDALVQLGSDFRYNHDVIVAVAGATVTIFTSRVFGTL